MRIEDLPGEDQEQSYVAVETPSRPIPQNTGFYGSFFTSLFAPSILQGPVPEIDDGLGASEDEWSEAMSQIAEGLSLGEEHPDQYLEEWVDIGKELDLEAGVAHEGSAT
jgi:hypothetical protein